MRLRADVVFVPAESGGRINPPLSGYGPQFKIGEFLTSCKIYPRQGDIMKAGILHDVDIELPFATKYDTTKVVAGYIVELFEGQRLVGFGRIRSIC